MNIKYNKKLKIIISCISLIICLSLIKSTYSKYLTEANGQANITVAKWKILVNNQDVIKNSNFTSTITPTFEGNSNIKDGVIAPQAEGYFDLIIDPTNTDVSFSYEITTSISEESSVQDLIITGYQIDDGDTLEFTEENIIKDTILYSENRTTKKIRIYIKWEDGESETMDNQEDTSVTQENKTAKINVNIKFIQTPNATTD
jgi:hypothetical protein